MHILIVHIHVKPECVAAFQEATLANTRHSLQEPGVIRFDVLQQQDDPGRFVLYEVYTSPDAVVAHKQTAHYQHWNSVTADMFVTPRTRALYNPLQFSH